MPPSNLGGMNRSEGQFDALLVLSFGGPEGPEDVRPFMENVTAGRGIPPERLDEVSQHYYHFGGVSPLNQLNRELIANVEAAVGKEGRKLPVYFGNRNWHPFGTEAVEQIAADGHRNVAVFATSAWGGYSGCKQYDEDILKIRKYALDTLGADIQFTKLRQFYDHPLFIGAFAAAVRKAIGELPPADRSEFRLVFSAHSIPVAADNAAGVDEDGPLYSRQVHEAARLVAAEVGIDDYDVVWQSRSGAAHIPWLEPDIVDHASALKKTGVSAIVVCPIGFISDHIEVIWDLDSELMAAADEMGLTVVRTATPGPTAEFAHMVVELVDEAETVTRPGVYEGARRLGTTPLKGCSINGAPCSPDCCPTRRR